MNTPGISITDAFSRLPHLRREAEALRQLDALKTADPLAFYRPHEKQDKFHAAGAFRRRYYRSGNRGGKSTGGVAEDLAWAIGERTWYKNVFDVTNGQGKVVRRHDPSRAEDAELIHAGLKKHAIKGLVLVSDWDKAEEIFTSVETGKMRLMCPRDRDGGYEKNQAGKVNILKFHSIWGGVSVIHFDTVKSYMSNKMGHESSDWDFIHVDEPCPKPLFEANARGLVDREGSFWFMCTPLTEMWINDMFLPPNQIRAEKPIGFEHTTEFQGQKIRSWMITGSMHDNPTLSAQAKAEFLSTLSEAEREAREFGRPRALSGAIYKEFEPDVHVFHDNPPGWKEDADGVLRPPHDWSIRVAIDPHGKTPNAVLFAATGPHDHTFFWNEIFEHCTINELAEQIKLHLGDRTPIRVICDPSAWNETLHEDGLTWADQFMQAELPVERAPKCLQLGIMQVQQALKQRDAHNRPFLHFSYVLTETLYEFDRYCWQQDKEKPIDMHDHMMENLYRLVNIGLTYVDNTDYAVSPKPMKITTDTNLGIDLSDVYSRSVGRKRHRHLTDYQAKTELTNF